MSSLQFSTHINHFPARLFLIEEKNKYKSLGKIKIKKSNKSLLPFLSEASQISRVQTPKSYFSLKQRPEVFLFNPPPLKFRLVREMKLTPKSIVNKSFSDFVSTPEPIKDYNRVLKDRKTKLELFEQHVKPSESEINYFKFIKTNNEKDLNFLLIKEPGIIKSVDCLGMTGLHWAGKRNLVEIGKLLISFGTDIFQRDLLNRSCKDIAKKSKSREFVKMLNDTLCNLDIKK